LALPLAITALLSLALVLARFATHVVRVAGLGEASVSLLPLILDLPLAIAALLLLAIVLARFATPVMRVAGLGEAPVSLLPLLLALPLAITALLLLELALAQFTTPVVRFAGLAEAPAATYRQAVCFVRAMVEYNIIMRDAPSNNIQIIGEWGTQTLK